MKYLFWTEVWVTENSVRNGYKMHQTLWGLFPNKIYRDFLFSVVKRQYAHGATILLQSAEAPIFPDEKNPSVKIIRSSKSLERLQFQTGQLLRFRLVANPTKKIKDKNDHERSLRVPYLGEENKIAWLVRKMQGVARICYAESGDLEPIYFSKPGHRGKIQPVLFTGLLEIEQGDAFLEIMRDGIGAAKSFGCGLIQVSRS